MLNITSAVHGFWPADEFVDLVDRPTGCGKVARRGCVYVLGTKV